MKSKILISLVLIAIALLVIAVTAISSRSNDPQPEDEQRELLPQTRTYENDIHGYSLSYPATLTDREYSPDNVVFGTIRGEAFDGVAEVRLVGTAGAPGSTFLEAVGAELIALCAADGPESSFSCTSVMSTEPFTTVAGAPGHVLYLRGELTHLGTQQVTEVRKGPYIVLPLTTSATHSAVLVVHPPLNLSADETDAEAIQAIAKSVVIENREAANDPVTSYLRDHISQLSPVKEQLGGTFYITRIEMKNGAGTVEYEDGHNAYTADFTYTLDENGAVTVTSFTVREQQE